jgi:hypothetical protein
MPRSKAGTDVIASPALRFTLCGVTAVLCLAAGGCTFGPNELVRTHGPYNEAVSRVYEEQLLRNLVHLRYNEPTSRLDIASISAQFELSTQAEARPFFSTEATGNLFRSFSTVLPDALVQKSDRPTFSMDPADEGEMVRRYLTPIPAETLIFLVETNWPVADIVRLWVDRLNGVPNAVTAGGAQRGQVPDFARFLRIAELIQITRDRELVLLTPTERITEVSGPLPADRVTASAAVEAAGKGLEYRPREDGKAWVLIRKERRLAVEVTPGSGDSPEVLELQALLNLTPGLPRYDLIIGTGDVPDPQLHPRPPSAEVRAAPRSTSQVYRYLTYGVEVPQEHVVCGLVHPAVDSEGKAVDGRAVTAGLFEVHASKGHKPPATAYVAVRYRGYWFYIDDRDAASKATLSQMLQLSRLDFSRQRPAGAPLLTLPVGR